MSSDLLFGTGYVLVGLVVAVAMARSYHNDPSDHDSDGASGGAALMAGIIWPVVVVVYLGAWASAAFYRLVTR